MVNLLLLSYLSDGFHVNLCFTQHLCHNTLFLRRWSLWSCVLWFHMLTLFNCKSSLVRFIALVCYFGISHRWIVPICVKSVICFWMFNVRFHFCIKADLYGGCCGSVTTKGLLSFEVKSQRHFDKYRSEILGRSHFMFCIIPN